MDLNQRADRGDHPFVDELALIVPREKNAVVVEACDVALKFDPVDEEHGHGNGLFLNIL